MRQRSQINAMASAIARRLNKSTRRQVSTASLASAVARRLQRGGRRSIVNTVASAVSRRLGVAGKRRLPDLVASAVMRRIKGVAPAKKRSRIDALASAVARRLAQQKEGGEQTQSGGPELPTHSESGSKTTGAEKPGAENVKRPRP